MRYNLLKLGKVNISNDIQSVRCSGAALYSRECKTRPVLVQGSTLVNMFLVTKVCTSEAVGYLNELQGA